MQVTVWSAVGDEGVQVMLSTTGACAAARTVRATEAVSLPAALDTVTETVLGPVELKLVLYASLLPASSPPLQA